MTERRLGARGSGGSSVASSTGPNQLMDFSETASLARKSPLMSRRRNVSTPTEDNQPPQVSVLSPVQQETIRNHANATMLAARALSPLQSVQDALAAMKGSQAYNAKHHTLFMAAQMNRVEVIRHLLRLGTTLDWPHPMSQQTYLHAACARGSADAVRVLLLADKGKIKKLWDGDVEDARMEGSDGYFETTFRATRSFKAVKRMPRAALKKYGTDSDIRPLSIVSQTASVDTKPPPLFDANTPQKPTSTLASDPYGAARPLDDSLRLPEPAPSGSPTTDSVGQGSPKMVDGEQDIDSEPSPGPSGSGDGNSPEGHSPTPSSSYLRHEKRHSGSIGDTDGTAVSHRTSIGVFDEIDERFSADFEPKRLSRVLLESAHPSMESLDKAFRGTSLKSNVDSIMDSVPVNGSSSRAQYEAPQVTILHLPGDEVPAPVAATPTPSTVNEPPLVGRRRLTQPVGPEVRQSVAETLVSVESSSGSSSFDVSSSGASASQWMRLIDFQDDMGHTPLHMAVLGAAGQADRQRPSGETAETEKHGIALPPSSSAPDFNLIVTILSREWPKTHLYVATQNGDLAFHLSCRYQLVHITRLLLDGEDANNALDHEFGRDADWEGEMWRRHNNRGLCGIHEALLGGMRPVELIRAAGMAEDRKAPAPASVIAEQDKMGIYRPLSSAMLRILLKHKQHAREMVNLKTRAPPSRFSYVAPKWYETLSPLSIALLRIKAAGGIWDDNAVGVIKLLVERGAEVDEALDVPILKELLESPRASDEIAGMKEFRRAFKASIEE